jgi:hypothetical protein
MKTPLIPVAHRLFDAISGSGVCQNIFAVDGRAPLLCSPPYSNICDEYSITRRVSKTHVPTSSGDLLVGACRYVAFVYHIEPSHLDLLLEPFVSEPIWCAILIRTGSREVCTVHLSIAWTCALSTSHDYMCYCFSSTTLLDWKRRPSDTMLRREGDTTQQSLHGVRGMLG